MIKKFGFGATPRARLTEDSLAEYPISLASDCHNVDGSVLDTTGGAGKFKIVAGTWGDGALSLKSVTDLSTSSYLSFEFSLPPEYIDGQSINITVYITGFVHGVGGWGSGYVDLEIYELTDAGAVGSDLCDTAQQTVTLAAGTKTFEVITAGLVAGDKIRVLLRNYNDAEFEDEQVYAVIGSIKAALDIRG